jgi:glycosyltransferase involved in cell wall biosynthesis
MGARTISILGSRGVPAGHGGFETLAEHLSLYLAGRGWATTVYCQVEGAGPLSEDAWRGVRRILVPTRSPGATGTVVFDWRSTIHAAREPGIALVLGYNTAAFAPILRAAGRRVVINMDGIEWQRAKWSPMQRLWLRLNERVGTRVAHDLIADHPEILRHLERHADAARITTIPYGARRIAAAPLEPVAALGLAPSGYLLVVARLEPENSILEIVRAFSARRRGLALAVVGPLDAATNAYHRSVAAAAGAEVRFLGPVYDQEALGALRFHALAYLHGHTVGGTNPSLVEAMGARNAVIAHDNRFNRWVAGDAARYFRDEAGLDAEIAAVSSSPEVREALRAGIAARFEAAFTWSAILAQYEQLLARPASSVPRPADG